MSQTLRLPEPWMTAEQFMDWPGDGTGRCFQLVEGEPVAMAPASPTHGRLLAEIVRLVGNHLRAARPDCYVVVEPGVRPWVGGQHTVRVPDFTVACTRMTRPFLDAPMLVGEILSPSNAKETRAAVQAYLSLPSVREVVLLLSEAVGAEVLCRDADGVWPREPRLVGAGETLRLDSVGFSVEMEALYEGLDVS